MNMQRSISLLVAGILVPLVGFAKDKEKKIKRSDLPAAVEKTVVAQSAGAKVKGFSEEKEKGQTFYEAELLVNGHSKDVLMDANGAIVEGEEEDPMSGLSPDINNS